MLEIKEEGWCIVHPDGTIELDFFHMTQFRGKYDKEPITPEQWQKLYRPGCQLVRGTVSCKVKPR